MNSNWLTLEEARQRIAAQIKPTEIVTLPLLEALGHHGARSLQASIPSPPFTNSMMDGYALRAIDSRQSTPLRLVGRQPAGPDHGLTCEPGEAIRIFTGAPIPKGADCVIMQEDCRLDGQELHCLEAVEVGVNLRPQGADLCVGQRLCQRGERMHPALLALIASQGMSHVEVHRRPQIMVISTGDELRAPGHGPLRPGEIYESVSTLLCSSLMQWGQACPTQAHCDDQPTSLRELLETASAVHDVVVISGGVSVGEHDPVKPALAAMGIEPLFWKIRIKPGKPFLFALLPRPQGGHSLLFGLPGNPVSAFVTAALLLRPALLQLMGAGNQELPKVAALLAQAVFNDGDRPHYVRGRLDGGLFTPVGLQQSHALYGLSLSQALLRVEPGQSLAEGHPIEVLPC